MNSRSMNIKLAWLFASMAVILFVASSFFVYASASVGKASSREILASQCIKEFEAAGVKSSIRPQDHAIVSYQSNVDLMQDRVNSSSLVIGRCAGYRLVEFCAGNGCPKPGVFFVLETL